MEWVGRLAYPGDHFGELGRESENLLHSFGEGALAGSVPGVSAAVLVLESRETYDKLVRLLFKLTLARLTHHVSLAGGISG